MNLIWITQAEYLSDYKIKLVFNDGFKGVVDLENRIEGTLFKPLKDKEYFRTFKKNSWTIEWNCKVDFAPEYLYELAKQGQN
ncbi:MAG: DUF2442 domain-containing protein [Flavobacteriaceae bacterium]|nr:DUF2442 domain-containing protein [Flavobacteriaceae bacterium]